eukprot:snap_masked-scaffold_13-processed-gene-11.19-mRNA-1 protein AED:1.00 eAED:1.00 QI:0/-1/0/0/-1/1/1/0/185
MDVKVVSPFIAILRTLSELVKHEVAGFSSCGSYVQIRDEENFENSVLKIFFNGSLDSFIRQLNLYGFKRSTATLYYTVDGRRTNKWCSHTCFHRDKPDLRYQIRKKDTPRRECFENSSCGRVCNFSNDLIDRVNILENTLTELDKMIAEIMPIFNDQLRQTSAGRFPYPTIDLESSDKSESVSSF